MRTLVVAGSSVSGQCALKAVKELDPSNIGISTTSREEIVPNADHTIKNIHIDQADAVDNMLASEHCKDIDYVIHIPARGDVGIPATEATESGVHRSIDYSLRPALALSKALNPKMTICLSGFITMPALLEVYGSTTYSKIKMELLAHQFPKKFKVIRFGMFMSNSVRGIAILVQRNMMKEKREEYQELHDAWKQSGIKKFQDFFWDRSARMEQDIYGQFSKGQPYEMTEASHITATFKKVLGGDTAPVVNVIGDWYWESEEMIPLPQFVQDGLKMVPSDLEAYFK